MGRTMTTVLWGGAVLLAVLSAGCGLGGQSGTEGTLAPHCVCQDVGTATPVRGILTSQDGLRYTLRVDDVIDPASAPAGLEPDREVGGDFSPYSPCGEGLSLEVGGEAVLALYIRGDQDGAGCPEYGACSSDRCGPLPEDADPTSEELEAWDECDTGCLEETREACATHSEEAWLGGRLTLASRADGDAGWLFGVDADEPIVVGDDESEILSSSDACYERFPAHGCDLYANGEPACDGE